MWIHSLKHSLRSLVRLLACELWARWLVLPALSRNERSAPALHAYVARRARALGIKAAPGATRLMAPPAGAALLTKAALLSDPARHVRARRPGSLIRNTIRTSGTSGSPLTLVQSLGAVVREAGFLARQLRWIGWRPGGRRAWLRGDIVCCARPADGRYWCRDWVGKRLMLSSYHLSNATIGAYLAALEAYDPVVIQAYPSSMAALANWLNARGARYRGQALRGVLTSSETLEPEVRAAIVRAFGVAVFDWYGQAERVAAIGTCEHGRYHVLTDYGAVELVARGQGMAELVASGLNNAAMPLQRYCTADLVRPGDAARCPCGRVFPTVAALVGRQERILTLPDGRIVARLDRVFQGFDGRLLEGQVLYHGAARFTLRFVSSDAFTDVDAAALRRQFLLRVPGVEVALQPTAAIPRGPNGKFEFVALAP